MAETKEKIYSLSHRFRFPPEISHRIIGNKHLLIASEKANWVAFDPDEFFIFSILQAGKPIREALRAAVKKYSVKKGNELLQQVVIQIEERQFFDSARVIEQPIFQNATLYVTRGCNLRCRQCYLSATTPAPDECHAPVWRTFLEEFRKCGGQVVTFSGGEPLHRKDILEIITHSQRLGFQTVLLTNGTRISEKNAETLGSCCQEIQISIDGPDRETHEWVRGKGTFRKVIRAIELLSDFSCRLSVAMTPIPETLPAISAGFADFVESLQHHAGREIYFRLTPRLLPGRLTRCLTSREQIKFYNTVAKVYEKAFGHGCMDQLDAAALSPNVRLPGCGYASSISVQWNGDIKACGFSQGIVGNIATDRLPNILDRLEAIFNQNRVEQLKTCNDCDLRYLCGGSCRIENFNRFGLMTTPCCDRKFQEFFYQKLVRISTATHHPIF